MPFRNLALSAVKLFVVFTLVLVLCFSVSLFAQTATTSGTTTTTTATTASSTSSTGVSFSSSSNVIALHYQGQWGTGTDVTESLGVVNFGANKTNVFSLTGNELLATTAGFNLYSGGGRADFDLSPILAKTNIPAGSLGAFVDASLGSATYSNEPTHMGWRVGGGIKYMLTSQLTWNTLQAGYVRVGSQNAGEISTGLKFLFTSSN